MSSPLGITFDLSKRGTSLGSTYKVYNGGQSGQGQKVKSIFNNASVFTPYPDGTIDPQTGTSMKVKKFADIHNDDIYDTSVSSLVRWSANKPAMKLEFSDFAYLKNLGVYPNNRLVVARRFGGGIGNDLHAVRGKPLATMISWIPDQDDSFLNVNYSENWVEADASYVDVLNDIGKSTKVSGDDDNKIGSLAARGLDMLPFPGLMEPIQRDVMAKFGLVDDPFNLPLGNPNLIRKAMRRYTVEPEMPGSGLNCEIQIKMVVEYEQKFINGLDPTLVYLDIIQNAIYFGTSDAAFQMSKGFATGANKLLANLISGNYNAIFNALSEVVKTIFKTISEKIDQMVQLLITPPDDDLSKMGDKIKTALYGAFNYLSENVIGSVIGKYKQRLLGITNSLTGSPSTPWHITIGNPKKPIFTSGDMLLSGVDLELGKVLAFNDLPSTIKFTLTFKNARPLGAQEIFNRLNTGRGRSSILVNIQTNTPKKNDGTIDQSAGPQTEEKVTKSFDSVSGASEDPKTSDMRYATYEGNGENFLSYKDPDSDNSGTIAENNEPVNIGEANVNENNRLENPSSSNPNNLSPSAQSGTGAASPQTSVPPAKFTFPPSPANTPLDANTAKDASSEDLTRRKKQIDKEMFEIANSLPSTTNPSFFVDPAIQESYNAGKAKLNTLRSERVMIEKEQKARR